MEIILTKLHCCHKVTNKYIVKMCKLHQGIKSFQHWNKTNQKNSTSHNKSRFEATKGTTIKSKAIFIKSGQCSQRTCFIGDNVEIQCDFMFYIILFPFVSIIQASLINEMYFFALIEKYPYKDCMRFLNHGIASRLERICITKLHL